MQVPFHQNACIKGYIRQRIRALKLPAPAIRHLLCGEQGKKIRWFGAMHSNLSCRDSGKVIAIPCREMFRCTMRHEPIASD